MTTPWECSVTGAGYTCVSNDPSTTSISKLPGCGAGIAKKDIYIPYGETTITFLVDVYTATWANSVTMEIVSSTSELVHTITRGLSYSNSPFTLDVSKYAGSNITFILSGSDDVAHGGIYYCLNGDHNMNVTIHDFKVNTSELIPDEPDESEWYDVFVDNAGYILLFVVAGVAINEIAK